MLNHVINEKIILLLKLCVKSPHISIHNLLCYIDIPTPHTKRCTVNQTSESAKFIAYKAIPKAATNKLKKKKIWFSIMFFEAFSRRWQRSTQCQSNPAYSLDWLFTSEAILHNHLCRTQENDCFCLVLHSPYHWHISIVQTGFYMC